MSDIRADGLGLKDPDDDEAFQRLVTDVMRIKQELRMGSNSGAGGTTVGGPTSGSSASVGSGFSAVFHVSPPVLVAPAVTPLTSFDSALGFDNTGGFDAATGIFTVPTAGDYILFVGMYGQNQVAAADALQIGLYRNGVSVWANLTDWDALDSNSAHLHYGVSANAGDTFIVQWYFGQNFKVFGANFSAIKLS